jgi:hypothetical protein
MDIGNKIWEAKCTYIYLRSSYSADRTFSETERPRALLTFLYDKLHMEPLLLPSEELLSRVISPCSQKTPLAHLMLYDSILVMSPRILA